MEKCECGQTAITDQTFIVYEGQKICSQCYECKRFSPKVIKEFKEEFRYAWVDAMGAWFECAGRMCVEGMDIPIEWEYKPALGSPVEEDSYYYEFFKNCSYKELLYIGNLLLRYCRLLKFYDKDY